MKEKRTQTEEANIELNKALDGKSRNKRIRLPDNYTATEEANIKLNDAMNQDNEDKLDIDSMINNNNISMVLKNNKKDDED